MIAIEYIPTTALAPWPGNPKTHDVETIIASMRRFGFTQPVLLDISTGQVVAGHGRLEALAAIRATGAPPPERVRVDDDVALSAMLAEIPDLTGVGFDADDVEMLAASAADILASRGAESAQVDAWSLFDRDVVIENAFAFFRARGFPYPTMPLHQQQLELNRLRAMDAQALRVTSAGTKVADTYHAHRFASAAQSMLSPLAGFSDDKNLRHAIDLELRAEFPRLGANYFGALNLSHGVQACANFRAGFAAAMYREHASSGGLVLDPSTGYGGRLLGWLCAGVDGEYVGVDPSTRTYAANTEMLRALSQEHRASLINAPFEDVDLSDFAESFAFAFTSPPYFAKEHYADEETQSFKRYTTIETWCFGFLRPLIHKTHAALQRGAVFALNIADVKIGSTLHPLTQFAQELAVSCGFTIERVDSYEMSNSQGDGAGKSEPVFVLRK